MPSIELSTISSTPSQTRPSSRPGPEGAGTKYVPLQQINVSETKKDQAHNAPIKQTFQSKVNEKWVIEIACCVGMLAALASVIGFLAAYDGRSIPDWPYGITVNTVLSLITLVLNACLTGVVAICVSQWKWISFHSQRRPLAEMNTYDWASRGGLGLLYVSFHFKYWYTTIGALAMILAAGNGPFVQQMVKVENNRISSDGVATLARAQSYSYTPSPSSTGNEPPVGMIGSIYASVFSCFDSDCSLNSSDASYSTVLPSCPSGECDFPRFTTLAVCSSCTDITNHLSHSTDTCNGKAEAMHTDSDATSLLTYSLPSGLKKSFRNDVMNSTYLKTTVGSSASKMRSIAKMPDYGNTTITDFTAIKYHISGRGAPEVNATQCSLYWCTKTIAARMTDNTFKENHVETHTEASSKYENLFVRLPPPENESSIIGKSESYFAVNAVTGFVKLQQEPSSTTWLDKKLEFDNLGEVTCNNESYSNNSVTDFTEPMSFYPVERLFENIAAGMTISVRRSGKSSQQDMVQLASATSDDSFGFGEGYKIGSAYNVPLDEGLGVVNGTSYRLETQIEVRWAWVTFPSILVLLAGGFLVITIFETRGSGVPLIKSSCIPLLSSGLDGEIQESLRMLNDPVAKDDASSAVMVQFIKDDQDSWRMEAIPI
ncbi:hypothetical protein N7450_011386 [Penicillium hetheringtonii]|uniref:Uncharacterized protein n=1 Tax=Penicillium hetheringtonii TaxID=911720 RepID=A0AAD6D9Y3_9EURO|nr:hypothetical protein N7450_011386 [Penicillium hetheringtonii]